MVFHILTTIVFLAELIILAFVVSNLLRIGKAVKEANSFLEEANPKIEQLAKLGTKISEQLAELAPAVEDKIKEKLWDLGIKNFKGILITTLLWAIKKKYNLKFLP